MNTVRSCLTTVVLFLAFYGPRTAADVNCTDPGTGNVTSSSCRDAGNGTVYAIETLPPVNGTAAVEAPENGTLYGIGSDGMATGNDGSYDGYLVRKCCPPNRAYDPGTRYCRKTDQNVDGMFRRLLARSTNGTTIRYIHKLFSCDESNATVLVDEPADEVQRLLDSAIGTDVQELPEDRCFDLKWPAGGENEDGELVARKCKPYDGYCRGDITCVKKCCKRENKMIVGQGCEETENPFRYPIHEISDRDTFTPSNNTLVTYYQSPNCLVYQVKTDFKLASNGSLYLTETGTYLPQSEFCMENYQPTVLDPELSAFVCKLEYSRKQEDLSDEGHGTLKYYALLAGFIPSVVCLLLTLLVYVILPTLRNVHGYYIMCYVTCMLVSVTCLLVIQWLQDKIGSNMCKFFGYATFFGFLATFCWLSVICFDIYWMLKHNHSVVKKTKIPFRTIVYHIYCWGFSSVCVIMAFIFQISGNKILVSLSPNMGIDGCWFDKNLYGYAIFYVTPVSIMLVINLFFFVLTAMHCARIKAEINRFKKKDSNTERFQAGKEKFAVSVKLFLVMGIPWSFEMFNKLFPKTWFIWYIFDEINALQGVMIFFVFVIKKSVLLNLRKRIFGDSLSESNSESTRVTSISNSVQSS